MTNPPGLPKYRHRKFKAVIHNIRQDSDTQIDKFFTQLKQPTIKVYTSIEPYTHQDGFHLHIYIEFKNQIWFHSLLKLLKDLSITVRSGVLPTLPGQAGRVDLKPWSPGQTWSNIQQYLVNPIKDKEIGKLTAHEQIKCSCPCGDRKVWDDTTEQWKLKKITHIRNDECLAYFEKYRLKNLEQPPRPTVNLPECFVIPGPRTD